MQYFVYREGWDAENQPKVGPVTVRVWVCEADSEYQAIKQAGENGVKTAPGQNLYALTAQQVEENSWCSQKKIEIFNSWRCTKHNYNYEIVVSSELLPRWVESFRIHHNDWTKTVYNPQPMNNSWANAELDPELRQITLYDAFFEVYQRRSLAKLFSGTNVEKVVEYYEKHYGTLKTTTGLSKLEKFAFEKMKLPVGSEAYEEFFSDVKIHLEDRVQKEKYLQQEAQKAFAAKAQAEIKAKEERRQLYETLKREFGNS